MATLDRNAFSDFLETNEFTRYINVFTKLDMQLVQSTIASAESGNLGDLYQLYEYLEASDARLKGMLNNRRKAVTKNKFNISTADMDDLQAVEASEFIKAEIDRLNWRSYLSELMNGRIYGVQVHQKVWYKSLEGRLCIKELMPVDKSKYGQANYFNVSETLGFGELFISEYSYGSSGLSLKTLIEDNAVIAGIDKNERTKYDMQGIMRGVARWYLIKLFAIQAWSQYAEKFGQPFLTAKVSMENYKENSALLRQLLSSVGSQRYGILLEEMEVDIVNGATSSNIDAFDRLISLCNTEMAIAILGQNLTTDISGGSYSASKTHMEVLQNLIEDDLEWIDEIINNQFVKPLIRVNFPNLPPELYPTYVTSMPEYIDIDSVSRGLESASRIVPIPVSFIYKKLGIPEPQNDEATIGGGGTSLLDEIINS